MLWGTGNSNGNTRHSEDLVGRANASPMGAINAPAFYGYDGTQGAGIYAFNQGHMGTPLYGPVYGGTVMGGRANPNGLSYNGRLVAAIYANNGVSTSKDSISFALVYRDTTGNSAVDRVVGALGSVINFNVARDSMQPGDVFISHYGWPTDPNPDRNSARGLGLRGVVRLTPDSLAITLDIANQCNLHPLGPVYINGNYIGNYDDRAPGGQNIDVYDPTNRLGTNWGGVLPIGATITDVPPGG